MFKHAYHGGSHVEILATQGKTPMKDWKTEGKIMKEYDKDMKQSVFILGENTKIQIPADEKTETLALVQQFLCFQLLISSPNLLIEIAVTDFAKVSQLFLLTISTKDQTQTYLPPWCERARYKSLACKDPIRPLPPSLVAQSVHRCVGVR